jgi:hypothetical protein
LPVCDIADRLLAPLWTLDGTSTTLGWIAYLSDIFARIVNLFFGYD